MTILHIANPCKFTRPLFDYFTLNLSIEGHEVISRSLDEQWRDDLPMESFNGKGLAWMWAFIKKANSADKVVIHSLLDYKVVLMLFFQPWLLKKCYWVIWGADLYVHIEDDSTLKWRLKDTIRGQVIKRIGYLVTYIKGDVDLAREWYGATGKYIECIAYTSNLYKAFSADSVNCDAIHIQVGNSAFPSNNHYEAFKILKKYKSENIQVFVPLSYGYPDYAKKVIEEGKAIFGEKFHPITEFMGINEYLNFLAQVDIAVFNHSRQQAMGNTLSLLSLGKKVYMKTTGTHYQMLSGIGVNLFDVTQIDLSLLSDYQKEQNRSVVSEYFSESNLKAQWGQIFEVT